MKKKLTILGSTGSIGESTLKVVRHLPDQFEVVALAAHSNIELLRKQIKEFSPKMVALYDEKAAATLRKELSSTIVVSGMEGVEEVAAHPDADLVVSAIVGSIGLRPTVAGIEAGKTIALANKEVLVAAGEWVMRRIKETNGTILPVDSEHAALHQCLRSGEKKEVRRLVLTASGGPFREFSRECLAKVTFEDALKHPTWTMGAKVTTDCSTLMNKGLEVIEAHWLFDIPIEQIEVVVHPQSIIHSMVEFQDSSVIAQLSQTDMVLPIQYALTYPERKLGLLKPFDFTKHATLNFYQPDTHKFPCLRLAYEALKEGGTLPCFMNAANEILVSRFLKQEISWLNIGEKLETLMQKHKVQKEYDLEGILSVEEEARVEAAHI